MPLLDHFHAPIEPEWPWESFHGTWASEIMGALNALLPSRYLAVTNVHLGRQVAADVAEFGSEQPAEETHNGPGGGVAVQPWVAPPITATVPFVVTDDIEVQIYERRGSRILVGVIELVSPANKDREDHRSAFAAKCAAYLQRGVGLVVVDVVTSRGGNLHNEFLNLFEETAGRMPEDVDLYATAYRPAVRKDTSQLDMWMYPLAVGQPLPTMPLALRGAFFVPVDLEKTYTEARAASRL